MPPAKMKAVTIAAAAAHSAKAPTSATGTAALTTSGRKRKMDEKNVQKYYAVRAGVRPGIYLTWHECQAQIAGFKGAQCKSQVPDAARRVHAFLLPKTLTFALSLPPDKSFISREDAAAFVDGKNPEGGAKDKGEPRFYAVVVGNQSGIYTEWDAASRAIRGAKGPKYKKFPSRAEAANFIRMYGSVATRQALSGPGTASNGVNVASEEEEEEEDEEDEEEEENEEEDDAAQILQPPAKRTKVGNSAVAASSAAVLNIYTDGSSLGNGKHGALAGIGVFFGHGDKRNISERLKGEPQTNQRAELTAIMRALQAVPVSQPVRIFSDSTYAINCVSEWYKSWAANGWKTRGGDAVMNQDLIRAVRTCIDARDKAGTATMFRWVKGHSSDSGNVAADLLANQGARLRT